MTDAASILAVGDVHLGTACSGLPAEIAEWGVDPADLTPAAALRLAVDFAIKQKVDAVLFAGDVVESTNARFEAMRPLEESVRRLVDKGIEVIAVAGNHDVEALPRLQKLIDGFKLLGAGGHWEPITLNRSGTPFAQVVGWSFGEKRVSHSPVAALLREPVPAPATPVPRIGLLHCDLGASGDRYAPVRQSELDDTGFHAWLLGHIHKPSYEGLSVVDGARPCGYLGSLVGLDPSETGPRGPWLLQVSGEGAIKLEQVPLAPVRWEHCDIAVDGIEVAEDLEDHLLAELPHYVEAVTEAGFPPQALGLRVRLTGSSPAYGELRKWVETFDLQALSQHLDGTAVFVNRIVDAMQLHLDLGRIASGDDPAALLAQRLLLLEQHDEGSKPLLDRARERLGEVAHEHFWSPIREYRNATDPLSDDALRNILLRSGRAALSAMLTDRQTAEGQ